MKKYFLLISAIFVSLFSSAQNNSQRPKDIFTEADWNKLSQHQKDSISNGIFLKYAEEVRAAQKKETAEADKTIEEASKNVNGTTSLRFTAFPKAQFDNEILKFKNLEEFSCEKCKALDLINLINQLAKFSKLKRLNLSGGTYKVLPNSIQQLTSLEDLQLADNNFVTLPDSFVQLQRLKTLNLKHNAYLYDDDVYDRLKFMNVESLDFSASGLLELNNKIGSVKSLKHLNIAVNDIKVLPASFNQLTKLEWINISENLNMDFGQVGSVLIQIPGIQELYAQQCEIGNLPLDIGKLANLKVLDLKGNRLTSLPLTFGNLTNLEYLDLGYFDMGTRMNKIDDLGPNFGQLKKLKFLNLAGNTLKILPSGFSSLTELENLNLNLNKLSEFPIPVTQFNRLKKLDLSLNEINIVPAQIAGLGSLEELHLDANFFNQPNKKIKTLPAEICNMKSLKVLTLKDNVIEQLPDCISSLSKLEKLDLRDNLLASLPTFFSNLKTLKWLDLKANDFPALPPNFQNLSSLKELNLSMNLKLNYESEKDVLMQMSQIEFLDLSYNNISKQKIDSLRSALPNCKVINWDYVH